MLSLGVLRRKDKRPLFLGFRASKAYVTFVVAFAVFVDQFIFAIIVPIVPFYLPREVGVSKDDVQYWAAVLLAVYGAGCFAISPLWGWYTDRSPSRRSPFMLAVLMLLAATAIVGWGESLPLQVLGRVLQGAAAGMLWITGLALIVDTVGTADVAKYMSYVSIAMMSGTLVAPIIGGVMYVKIGYTPIFIMLLGIIALDLLLRFTAIEVKDASKWLPPATPTTPDSCTTPASHTSVSSPPDEEKGLPADVAPTTAANTQHSVSAEAAPATRDQHPRCSSDSERNAPSSPSTPSTPPDLAAKRQRRRRGFASWRRQHRLPPVLTLLASRRLLCALWGTLVVAALFSGMEATLTLQTEELFGWDAVGGGLVFLPLTVMSFAGPAVGWACDRWGPRWPTTAGFLLLCPMLVLLRLVAHDTLRHKVLLYALLAVIGACFTLTLNPLMAEIAYVVERKSGRSEERASNGDDGGDGDDASSSENGGSGGDRLPAPADGTEKSSLHMGCGDGRSMGVGNDAADAERRAAVAGSVGGRHGSEGRHTGSAAAVPQDRGAYAQAFALFNMAYSLGNAVGPLCAGLVRDAAGWPTMAWVLGLFSAVSAVLACLCTGGWIGSRRERRWQRPARAARRA